jgi:MazG family protein
MSDDKAGKGVRVDPQDYLEEVRRDPAGFAGRPGKSIWFQRLVGIMDVLRSPGGCPWDLEQEPRTIRSSLLEETYEVLEAIDGGDDPVLCEELGDLLLQIVFLSRMRREAGAFDVEDVARAVVEKLVRRHPHVFGEARADSSTEVTANWERIKDEERREKGHDSLMSGLPATLPALLKCYRIGQKAERVGFDWESPHDVLDKVREETRELEEAMEADDVPAVREELGDLLFALGQMGRKLGLNPEDLLREANDKFLGRFRRLENRMEESDLGWDDVDTGMLESLWEEIKH